MMQKFLVKVIGDLDDDNIIKNSWIKNRLMQIWKSC